MVCGGRRRGRGQLGGGGDKIGTMGVHGNLGSYISLIL